MLKLGASMFANRRKQRSYLTDTNGFTNPVYYSRLANPYFEPFAADGSYRYAPIFKDAKTRRSTSISLKNEPTLLTTAPTIRLMLILDAELKLNSSL